MVGTCLILTLHLALANTLRIGNAKFIKSWLDELAEYPTRSALLSSPGWVEGGTALA